MSEKLKIVYRPLQELSPYAHNARTHSPEQVAQLVESIKQFGWTNPVLIDEKGEIIAGHGRVMAAEMLKMDSVPVIVLSGLTDEQKKAYRLADNRLPMNAGWDEDLLRMELSDLINADFDVSLTGFIPTEIDELLTDVLPGNRAAINSMFTSLSGELNELAIYEAGYQLSLFDSLLPDFVADVHPLVGISSDALYAAAMARPFQGRLLSEWALDLEADRLRRITNTVRQGFLLGDTNEQIARKIRGHVSKGFQDGALQMSRANAASIAKTAVGHLAATARESFASANNDLIKGKQWLSTLDNRTTPQCRIRDRLKYTLDNKPVGHSVPYLHGPGKIHFCCRSTETFILKSAKELGIDVRDISPAERASMDGVVAGDTTYREWFLRQPYTRQKQIVGETRAKLIRDGGMSPDEFYTDKGEWLTLKQLRERDAQVFRKAGI
ncbi:TPA: ParB N-terminal domain-containing protein [Escherichia coli]|nr:ParB N-terminal domain-containing protein [Escherichia coli]HAW3307479.1 ParB N-terminal domain-containing protein [Escherichia coli]